MTPRDWCTLLGLLAGAAVAAWIAAAPVWPENQTTGSGCGPQAQCQEPDGGASERREPRA